uniref:Caerulein-2.2/2.2Y4 n=1 Tax=Ranoidea citropa TaxID=94770 RepID=CAE22_RANCI|nr:RecName: Full=Caerulein-2.2/2.2Y4 [Ranoidea citropa]
QQDYTGAHFDF